MKALRRTIIDELIIPVSEDRVRLEDGVEVYNKYSYPRDNGPLDINEELSIEWCRSMGENYGGGDFYSSDEVIDIPDEEWEAFKAQYGEDEDDVKWLWADFAEQYGRGVPAFDAHNRPTLDDVLYLYNNLSKDDQYEFRKQVTGIDPDRFLNGIGIAVERM